MAFLARVVPSLLVCAAAYFGVDAWLRASLPRPDRVARGVRVGSLVADGSAGADELARAASRVLDRPIALRLGQATLAKLSLRELGAQLDEVRLRERLLSVGREGSFFGRLVDAREASRGARGVALHVDAPLEPLAAHLASVKERHDRGPVPSRFDFANGRPTEHVDGALIDVGRTLERLLAEALDPASDGAVEVAVFRVEPWASSEAVARIDRSALVGRYETRYAFYGAEAGRAQNVARAARGIDGLVLMPGAVVSFNDAVGPRSEDNGFSRAGEIYKGELRLGVGGGTCQVASTLHATAFFAGLEVVERSPHSRPSGYIGIGLDATVAYPTVDLALKNPFPFPIVVHAVANAGNLTVELWGRERPADVELATATIAAEDFERKLERVPYLAEGRIVRKQAGRRGVTIEKTRALKFRDGARRVETTRDVYPPTTEIFLLGPGADEATLPPLAATST